MFSRKFIQTIAEWQNFGGSDKKVTKAILNLEVPQEFKICNEPIYRVIGVNDISDVKIDNIGSWSIKETIAKQFVKSLWFQDFQTEMAVLLMIQQPKSSNIILNLHAVWANKEFRESIAYYEDKGLYFNEGLDFEDDQKEVIYKTDKKSQPVILATNNRNKWIPYKK
jgi:hypothetical protein